ncbi:shikimate kinase [Paenibacillus lemnae]|uniref:Shikimate kinase n=1 Tax=Paenibacillus lemnae TaxID=1330551 RepID=A0A848M1R6_PAELE|nr:shikimate kinase [Paenibacillus lemnae]NMO94695.1 shikimate kinase [Paenibacillus lemnae]
MDQRDRNIILVGMMGTGKSTAGRLIAQELDYTFVDLDQEIEMAAGRPIADIFASDGEPVFRDLESAMLEQMCSRKGLVIATGGGAVLRKENCELMSRKGWVAALTAEIPAIVERVSGDRSRPLLSGGDLEERVRRIMEERKECYSFAEVTVDTTGLSAHEVGREILMHYRV